MTYNVLLEGIITDLGGCGRYQCTIVFLIQMAGLAMAWSMLFMMFAGQHPGFHCSTDLLVPNSTFAADLNNTHKDACAPDNSSTCSNFVFGDEMKTPVTQFDLVCDRKWIIATITTIQMAGVLVGCVIAGQLGDSIGRKPTFFIGNFILSVSNIVAIFSPTWQVYAVMRFVIGIGCGFFLTVMLNLMIEFVPQEWRARTVGLPTFELLTSLMALVAWLFPDWKHLHIAITVISSPLLLTWWIMPESFRWLTTKQRFESATGVIKAVAKLNKREMPDLNKIFAMAKAESEQTSKLYTAIDVFRYNTKITLGLCFLWMSVSYSFYGLSFGIVSLPGNLYLNMFIMNIVTAPSGLTVMVLANKIGRKKTCIITFMVSGVCGVFIGILQYIDTPVQGDLTNVMAYISKFTMTAGWIALAVLSIEQYPTVIRTIAYGLCNTSARIGGMVAPQIVFLNDSVPGILFFLSGGLMIVSALICFIFPETMGRELEDTLTPKTVAVPVEEKEGDRNAQTKF